MVRTKNIRARTQHNSLTQLSICLSCTTVFLLLERGPQNQHKLAFVPGFVAVAALTAATSAAA